MRVVTVNNKAYELDYYGNVLDTKVVTHVATSQGIVELTLQLVYISSEIVIQADMWRGGKNLESTITMFRAAVTMQRMGERYRIREKRYRECNDLWRELEVIISNVILLNE